MYFFKANCAQISRDSRREAFNLAQSSVSLLKVRFYTGAILLYNVTPVEITSQIATKFVIGEVKD